MPMMVASTGSFSVSGVRRALEPWTISTISPWPAPTVSTQTKVRPVLTSLPRPCGSTRSGSTVSSLRPVIAATFCVATTKPLTRARNMVPSLLRFEKRLRLPRHDQLLVGRHDPQLHPAVGRVNGRLALGRLVARLVQADAEPVEVRTHRLAHPGRVLADAAGEHDGVGAVVQQQVSAEVVPYGADEHVDCLPRRRVALLGCGLDVAQVVAAAAESLQAGAVGEVVQYLLQRLAGRPHDRGEREDVEVADAVVVR